MKPDDKVVLTDEPLLTKGRVEFHYWDGRDAGRVPPVWFLETMGRELVAVWAAARSLFEKIPGGREMMGKKRRVIALRRADALPSHQGRAPVAAYVWHGGMKLAPGQTRKGDVIVSSKVGGGTGKRPTGLSDLVHELAHAYWYEVVTRDRALRFIDAHQRVDKLSGAFDAKSFVSPYAWSSPEEDFAESLMVKLMEPATAKRYPLAMEKLELAL